ncbi:MAG: DUF1285 domain-containing protein [Candidatus Dormibacteria bacterium]
MEGLRAGSLEAVVAAASAAAGRPLPPVHLWNPAHCGEIDIVIRRDGTWLHEGTPIGRPALVRLFSTVLRKDPEGFVLVTPAEKLAIAVEDAPFLAVALEGRGRDLAFTTNVGDTVVAGPEHPIRVQADAAGAPAPYVRVRGGLEARIVRSVFYELAEIAQPIDLGAGPLLCVASGGVWFPLGPAEAGA